MREIIQTQEGLIKEFQKDVQRQEEVIKRYESHIRQLEGNKSSKTMQNEMSGFSEQESSSLQNPSSHYNNNLAFKK